METNADTYAEAAVKKIAEALPKSGSEITISDSLLESVIALAYLEGRRVGIAEAREIYRTEFDKAVTQFPLVKAANERTMPRTESPQRF